MSETATETYVPRLKTRYLEEVRPRLANELGLNLMAVPRLEKIVLNAGLGDSSREAKLMDDALAHMIVISGQKPVTTKSNKSIANFKLRAGMTVGAKVTLRGDRMWEFLDRLLSVALPRIRDFRGLSTKAFDGRGNYTIGVSDPLIFPEVDYDKVGQVRGLDITIVTTSETNEHGRALLEALGFPFRRD
jgi:large subunit ribosomal protein L5